MKRILLIVVLIAAFSGNALYSQNSEKIKLKSLSLSSGEGALSNGVFFEANFSRKHDLINISLGGEDMYFLYLKSLGKNIYLGPSVEYYHEIPTLGIMANLTLIKLNDFSIGAMTWSGISAGKPDEKIELLNWQFLFFWQSIDINYKRFTASGAVINFDNVWGGFS